MAFSLIDESAGGAEIYPQAAGEGPVMDDSSEVCAGLMGHTGQALPTGLVVGVGKGGVEKMVK